MCCGLEAGRLEQRRGREVREGQAGAERSGGAAERRGSEQADVA